MACEAANAAEKAFDSMAEAIRWVRDHPTEAAIGTAIVIGGVIFIVATDGAGAVILVPAL
jgi:hypothetical protein